ncbi:MAG TPA: TetR/AcrR family transcriptional regulator [Bacilli bacterium]|nr:TetR/AcrR family transcriptional regulator [Bacilli bacterium]HPS18623.1 TetR/AcrR family transcriptional regulator [Bacilli bacterium]
MSAKTPKNKPNTKELLTLSLNELMLKKEFKDISISEICENAHVSRMTFYRHFDDKEDIFVTHCDDTFETFFSECQKLANPTTEEIVLYMFSFFKKCQPQINILKKAEKQDILVKQFYFYSRYILCKIPSIREHFDLDNKVIFAFLAGGIFNILMRWVDNGMKETPEYLAKCLLDVFKNT